MISSVIDPTAVSPSERLARMAAAYGSAPAVETASAILTYAELEAAVARLADALRAAGGGAGDTVAVYASGTPDFIVAALAAMRVGCVYAPLAPDMPPERRRHMVAELLPSLIVCAREARASVDVLRDTKGAALRPLLVFGFTAANQLEVEAAPADGGWGSAAPANGSAIGLDDPCYVYFTSGSTGKPKGIVGRRKAVAQFIDWEIQYLGLERGVRVGSLVNPLFDAWLRDVLVPLSCGGTIVVPPSRDVALGGTELVAWLEAKRVNLIHCVPAVFRSIIPDAGSDPFTALRQILIAGEALSPADLRRWHTAVGPRIQLVNLYGQTETTMVKFCHRVVLADGMRRRVPIGKPMTGCRAIVLDDQGKPCPPGVPGALYVRTPYASLGYLNKPEMTAGVFVPNPFSRDPADKIYRTGDIALVGDNGDFEYLGRSDHLIKIRGNRVELAEIEAAFREHPDIMDVVAAAAEAPNGDSFVCLYFVARNELSTEVLRSHAARFLPDYMVPAVFMRRLGLPRLANGKIARTKLPRPILRSPHARPPGSERERALATLWGELLGCENVGVDEDFFQLGGHSLTAMKLRGRIFSQFGADLPLETIYRHPNIAALAIQLGALEQSGPPLAVAVAVDGEYPLSSLQERLYVEYVRDRTGTAYNVSVAFRLDIGVDASRVDAALSQVVRRHHALRTTFHVGDSGLVQRLHAPGPVHGEYTEISDADVRDVFKNKIRPFVLETLPLFRFVVVKHRPSGVAYVLIDMHHIVTDAQSFDLFIADFRRAYRGETLAELGPRYVDYAAWERSFLASREADVMVEYWRRQLADAPLGFSLPPDMLPSDAAGFAGARLSVALTSAMTTRLSEVCAQAGATKFMFFFACWLAALAEGGECDLVIGTTVSCRPFRELEDVMGFFGNELAIRFRAPTGTTFTEWLAATRQTLIEAFLHQDAPYSRVVAALRAAGAPNHGPLFRIKFQFWATDGMAEWDPAVTAEAVELYDQTAQNDIRLAVVEHAGEFRCYLEYRREMYFEHRMQALLDRFADLVVREAQSPHAAWPIPVSCEAPLPL